MALGLSEKGGRDVRGAVRPWVGERVAGNQPRGQNNPVRPGRTCDPAARGGCQVGHPHDELSHKRVVQDSPPNGGSSFQGSTIIYNRTPDVLF